MEAKYFQAAALDFDGTLTQHGRPETSVLEALGRTRRRGVKVVLVTGRIGRELREVFPDVNQHFDALVLENGGVLAVGQDDPLPLVEACDDELGEELARRGVAFRAGQVLLASQVEHEAVAREVISRLELECVIVRNRGEMMILPAGVTKASGVRAALEYFGLSPHNAVGAGDAENDHVLLDECEVGVAVDNAVDSLKRRADVVLDKANGSGIADFLDEELDNVSLLRRTQRRALAIGKSDDEYPATIPSAGVNLLVTGRSSSGKSFAAGMIAEQLLRAGYSLCLLDPEGDYAELARYHTVQHVGGKQPLPSAEVIAGMLRPTNTSIVVDLSLCGPEEQVSRSRELLGLFEHRRIVSGRPHWIFIDEAHRLLPSGMLKSFGGFCLVSYWLDRLDQEVWDALDYAAVLPGGTRGAPGCEPIREIERRADVSLNCLQGMERGEMVLLDLRHEPAPLKIHADGRSVPHVRHRQKYAFDSVAGSKRFFFKPEHANGAHPAANVQELYNVLKSCDPALVEYHGKRRDFSRWLRDVMQDAETASQVRSAELSLRDDSPSPGLLEDVRSQIMQVIHAQYLG